METRTHRNRSLYYLTPKNKARYRLNRAQPRFRDSELETGTTIPPYYPPCLCLRLLAVYSRSRRVRRRHLVAGDGMCLGIPPCALKGPLFERRMRKHHSIPIPLFYLLL